ncbi:hypothetical protein ACHAXH_008631 [Discostella pseudostelligera]|jgi:hypothetical protein
MASASAAPSQASGTNESIDSRTKISHDNDAVSNMRRAFTDYTTALIYASRHAGSVSSESTKVKPADENDIAGAAEKIKDPLEEAAALIVKRKQALRSNATLLEGKLRGNVKESEALQCCLRSQPCVSGRKRTFSLMNTHG